MQPKGEMYDKNYYEHCLFEAFPLIYGNNQRQGRNFVSYTH
jgi:hypothetical protein